MPATSRPGTTTTNLDTVFGALAHRTRRAILLRLRRGPASVGQLSKPFGVSQQAISKHIAVLQSAGLVRQRKQGRESQCILRTTPLREAERWMEFYRPLWDERFKKLAGYLESTRTRKHEA
jgi:DNA-binding transcriptional ArsR family regulator